MTNTIQPKPLSPEQREKAEFYHHMGAPDPSVGLRGFPAWDHVDALLAGIAYLEEERKGAILVPVEAAKRMERWAMKASFEYAHDAQTLPETNAEKARESARQANADAQTIAAALGQTHQEGTK